MPRHYSSSSSSGSRSSDRPSREVERLVASLSNHRVNTLTELCRIERVAAACTHEADARAFQQPMTSAWTYYVASNQLLAELRGLTRSYPLASAVLSEALARVRADPDSNRSWNLAWLCLLKIRDDGLVPMYAQYEAERPEMWGGRSPSDSEMDQLAACFEYEWTRAIETMLRHWDYAPTWY